MEKMNLRYDIGLPIERKKDINLAVLFRNYFLGDIHYANIKNDNMKSMKIN